MKRPGQLVGGAAIIAGVAAGAYTVASGEIDASATFPAVFAEAQPSDDLANAFDIVVAGGALLGTYALAKNGAGHIRRALNDEADALHQIARADRSSLCQRVVPASLIVVGAAAMTGNFIDIDREVSTAQSDVADILPSVLDSSEHSHDGEDYIITNSPQPELSSNSNLSQDLVHEVISDNKGNVHYIPGRWEWHAGEVNDEKFTVLAASFPQEVTKIESGSESCDGVGVNVAEELGLQRGDTLKMDGLTLRVRETIDNSSGLGLLPVIFNNEDFARCVQNNPDQPFGFVLARGEKEEIERQLAENGLSPDNLSSRAFVVPVDEFLDNTEETGENNVSPLVLQAMGVAAIFAGAALSNRSRNRLTENRRINAVWHANGLGKSRIAQIYRDGAESEAIASSLVAAPVIVLLDAYTNSGIPGAEIGPSVTTFLCVVGTTWAINKAGTAVAIRREAPHIEAGKGHIL